jgi:hypothetical protein
MPVPPSSSSGSVRKRQETAPPLLEGLFCCGWLGLPGIDDREDRCREGADVGVDAFRRSRALGVADVLVELRQQRFRLVAVPRSMLDEGGDALHLGGQLLLVGERRADLRLDLLVGVPNVAGDSAVVEHTHVGWF